jgi:predicted thioesterase
MTLETGLEGSVVRTVGDADTALALGSGDMAVLGTPRVVAWCEAATVQAVEAALESGATTVGTNVSIDHLAPSPVGAEVVATAIVREVDRRRLLFDVTATCGGDVIARGTVTRAVVERDGFMARLA